MTDRPILSDITRVLSDALRTYEIGPLPGYAARVATWLSLNEPNMSARTFHELFSQVPKDPRGTGRTTRQMQAAPRCAVYVWPHYDLHYPARIRDKVERGDLHIANPNWFRGVNEGGLRPDMVTPLNDVVLDHALKFDASAMEAIGRLKARGVKIHYFNDLAPPGWGDRGLTPVKYRSPDPACWENKLPEVSGVYWATDTNPHTLALVKVAADVDDRVPRMATICGFSIEYWSPLSTWTGCRWQHAVEE